MKPPDAVKIGSLTRRRSPLDRPTRRRRLDGRNPEGPHAGGSRRLGRLARPARAGPGPARPAGCRRGPTPRTSCRRRSSASGGRAHRAADPTAYLLRLRAACALDWQRAPGPAVPAGGGRGPPEAEPLFAGPAEQDERRAAVEAALARLPETQREVLVMKVWGGLSFPQIAAALGIPAEHGRVPVPLRPGQAARAAGRGVDPMSDDPRPARGGAGGPPPADGVARAAQPHGRAPGRPRRPAAGGLGASPWPACWPRPV